MTPPEVAALAKRILAAIPERDRLGAPRHHYHDRKRVQADLTALNILAEMESDPEIYQVARAEIESLTRHLIDSIVRTGRVYGIEQSRDRAPHAS